MDQNGEDLDDRPSGMLKWLALVILTVCGLVCWGVVGYLTGP